MERRFFAFSTAFLVLMAAATPFFALDKVVATGWDDVGLEIHSPQNTTYFTHDVLLNFSWNQYLNPGGGGYHIGYYIDDELHLNLGVWTNVSGSYVTTLHDLSDGYHKLTIYVSGGFPGLTFGVDFTVDTSFPLVAVLSPTDTTYHDSILLQFHVDEPVSWMGYSLDGQNNVTLTEEHANLTGLPDGSHTMRVYANDTDGNMGASKIVKFNVDNTPPTVSVMAPKNTTYSTPEIPLNFTVNEQTSKTTYCLDGQENVTVNGNITLTGLLNGKHNLTVYATDKNGNTGASETIHFEIDTTSPILVIAVASVASIAAIATFLIFFTKHRKQHQQK